MRMRGFTLIEMAIVITVIGLLMTAFTAYWQVFKAQHERDLNIISASQINSAIAKYYGRHGFYPCPAGPAFPLGDLNRGVEMRYTAGGDLPAGATAVNGVVYGRCMPANSGNQETDLVSGVARVNGHRVNPSTGLIANVITTQSLPTKNMAANTAETSVFIGAVPYVTLGLPEKYTYDAYGMKFTYAVSASVTHNNTFNALDLNVTVQKFNYNYIGPGKTFTSQNFSVLYTAFSSGRDRLGAYSSNGTVANPCPAVDETSDAYSRNENCDGDALFVSTGDASRNLSYNAASPTHYFDDVISSLEKTSSSTWDLTPNTANDIRSVNVGNIGIGANPNSKIKLDVNGSARADKITLNTLCALSAVTTVGGVTTVTLPNYCFDPRTLAGDPDSGDINRIGGMKCDPEEAIEKIGGTGNHMTPPAIASADVRVNYNCVRPGLKVTGLAGQVCGPGLWVTGFDNAGAIVCGP